MPKGASVEKPRPDPSPAAPAKGFHHYWKEWIGPLASSVFVLGALVGVMMYLIRSEVAGVTQEVNSLKENVSSLKADLVKTNDRMDGVFSQTIERLFPKPTA